MYKRKKTNVSPFQSNTRTCHNKQKSSMIALIYDSTSLLQPTEIFPVGFISLCLFLLLQISETRMRIFFKMVKIQVPTVRTVRTSAEMVLNMDSFCTSKASIRKSDLPHDSSGTMYTHDKCGKYCPFVL